MTYSNVEGFNGNIHLNSSECFGYIKDWVEKKIRRHLMYARKRRGFGWNRWSRDLLYDTLGVFNDYGVRYYKT